MQTAAVVHRRCRIVLQESRISAARTSQVFATPIIIGGIRVVIASQQVSATAAVLPKQDVRRADEKEKEENSVHGKQQFGLEKMAQGAYKSKINRLRPLLVILWIVPR